MLFSNQMGQASNITVLKLFNYKTTQKAFKHATGLILSPSHETHLVLNSQRRSAKAQWAPIAVPSSISKCISEIYFDAPVMYHAFNK